MEKRIPKAGGPDANTEQRAAELDRVLLMAELAQRIGHDLNNALTATLGFAGAALAEPVASADMRASLESLQNAADRASTLAQQLVTVHRRMSRSNLPGRALNPIVLELRPLLEALVGEGRMELALAEDEPTVAAEEAELEQAVVALVQHARRGANGHRIRLSTRVMRLAEPMPQANMVPGVYVALEVSAGEAGQEASGFQAAPILFATQAAALGLEAVLQVARKLGGVLDLRAGPAGGATTSRLLLPRADLVPSRE